MRLELRSPAWTTDIAEVPTVRAGWPPRTISFTHADPHPRWERASASCIKVGLTGVEIAR